MNLVRLIYVSRFSPGLGSDDLSDILRISREKNPARQITGLLCYAPGVFLQCLEGPRDAINEIYRLIAADERHRDATVLEYADIRERTFGKWAMAYVRADDLGALFDLLPSAGVRFDPFEMTAAEAHEFMTALARKREDLLTGVEKDQA